MAKSPALRVSPPSVEKDASLMVRVDSASKALITSAAGMRGISTSDYVRTVVVGQARRELEEARTKAIVLSADEQLLFWTALHKPGRLTKRQRKLGELMRGER
jgi:uncharacterized protein (DUF1778 family)